MVLLIFQNLKIYIILDINSIIYSYTSCGNDWAIFRIKNNKETGLDPFTAQKSSIRILDNWDKIFTNYPAIRITGYGVDQLPKGSTGEYNSRNLTQQTDTETIKSETFSSGENEIIYLVDTQGGHSGSPLYIVPMYQLA